MEPSWNLLGLSCRRVLDNAEVHLSSEQLWAHLNYQLIHLIDFLPATAWQVTFNDYFAVFFVRLHALLQREGKLPPRRFQEGSKKVPRRSGCSAQASCPPPLPGRGDAKTQPRTHGVSGSRVHCLRTRVLVHTTLLPPKDLCH